MAALVAENLSFHVGAKALVEGVSFEANPGELIAILGPNGAGKSTLMRLLLGLKAPSQGRVLLEDRALNAWKPRERAQVMSWVPQAFDTSLLFSGLELVLMGRAPHQGRLALPSASDEAMARSVMAELGVEGLAERRLNVMSGGELRMLLLARALVQTPRILMLDEPTAFLDLRHQVETLQAVKRRVKESGLSAVAVLHDVHLAQSFADRVLLMRGGRSAGFGTCADVLTRPVLAELYGVEMGEGSLEDGTRVFLPRS